jgi:hypothetical protein
MATLQRIALGLIGGATTVIVRRLTRRTMHEQTGRPRLPRGLRKSNSIATMLALAGTAGALLALGDVLQEQRKHVAERA